MTKTTVGARLKTARKKRQWTLANLGRQAGITKSRLSQFENEHRYPTEQEWDRLRPLLNLAAYQPFERCELPAARKLWTAPEPSLNAELDRPLTSRLYAARKSFGAEMVDQALALMNRREDRALCAKFLERAGVESGHELLFWLKLLGAGAQPCRISLAKAGFRRLAVVDQKTRDILGDLRHSCLDLEGDHFACLFFPQVTVDTRKAFFRLDALACVYSGRERYWVNIEIDGQGHNHRFDEERQEMLGLSTVRLDSSEVGASDTLAILKRKLIPLLGLPKAS